VQALSLAKECVINKLDLLTYSTIVDDDDEVKVHILEKQHSSKYKLTLLLTIVSYTLFIFNPH
jgi:hypothetical protein